MQMVRNWTGKIWKVRNESKFKDCIESEIKTMLESYQWWTCLVWAWYCGWAYWRQSVPILWRPILPPFLIWVKMPATNAWLYSPVRRIQPVAWQLTWWYCFLFLLRSASMLWVKHINGCQNLKNGRDVQAVWCLFVPGFIIQSLIFSSRLFVCYLKYDIRKPVFSINPFVPDIAFADQK